VDAATVPDPSPFGGSVSATDCFRSDASAVVALDGVVGEDLRSALLDAVTEPGWDHATSASPPTPMWDRATDDGINGTEEEDDSPAGTFRPAPGSWGLTEEGLRQVASDPATQVFLSRIQALYPEYHVRTMPADALEPDGIPGKFISTIVWEIRLTSCFVHRRDGRREPDHHRGWQRCGVR
jgi:probable phosphoglycerate mutase